MDAAEIFFLGLCVLAVGGFGIAIGSFALERLLKADAVGFATGGFATAYILAFIYIMLHGRP